jgi:hypothetical protein
MCKVQSSMLYDLIHGRLSLEHITFILSMFNVQGSKFNAI